MKECGLLDFNAFYFGDSLTSWFNFPPTSAGFLLGLLFDPEAHPKRRACSTTQKAVIFMKILSSLPVFEPNSFK
jgi:hypothetical protein